MHGEYITLVIDKSNYHICRLKWKLNSLKTVV